jgi:hypothetical protein
VTIHRPDAKVPNARTVAWIFALRFIFHALDTHPNSAYIILVTGYFVPSLRAFFSEAILLKSGDCFGKKRLAMTHIPTRNEYTLTATPQTDK